MIWWQVDLSLLQKEIEDFVCLCDIKIIALFFSPGIWDYYCFLALIPFGSHNFFIISDVIIIKSHCCDILLESSIPLHTLKLAAEG